MKTSQRKAIHAKKHHRRKGISSEHLGFESLARKATAFYKSKGVPEKEAEIIGRKVAGRVNAKYVHHFRGH